MSEFTETLSEKHVEMIGKQPIFFTATAANDGRINLSPKGYDAFRVLSPHKVAYLDLAQALAAQTEDTALAAHFALLPGTRQIFLIDVESVQTSCGWGVPFMSLDRERDTLQKAHAGLDAEAWLAKTKSRTTSIDGISTRVTDRYFGPTD